MNSHLFSTYACMVSSALINTQQNLCFGSNFVLPHTCPGMNRWTIDDNDIHSYNDILDLEVPYSALDVLIDFNADIYRRTSDGETVLHLLCERSDIDPTIFVASILKHDKKRHGNLKDLVDNFGRSALEVAVRYKHFQIVVLLLNDGASCQTQTNIGLSALHLAVGGGKFKYVNLLLNHGADASALDRDNRTPVDYAVSCNRMDMAMTMILSKGPQRLNRHCLLR